MGGVAAILIINGILDASNGEIQNASRQDRIESAPILERDPSDRTASAAPNSLNLGGEKPVKPNSDAPASNKEVSSSDAASDQENGASDPPSAANEVKSVIAQSWYDRLRVHVYLTEKKQVE